MPDLHDMLTEAAPPVPPGFDADDVRARVADADQRRRRVTVGSMLTVVLLAGVLVVPALRSGDGQGQVSVDGATAPLSTWPASLEFAGVEIGVQVLPAPDEALGHRIQLGAGEAALSLDPAPDGGVDPRLWVGCGGEVVRLQALGSIDGQTATEAGTWLPVGALVEAGRQLVERQGCTPTAPTGTPAALHNNQNELHDLAAAIDRAGFATCCASVGYDPEPSATFGGGVGLRTRWTVLIDREPLAIAVDFLSQVPAGLDPVRRIEVAGGTALTTDGPNATVAAVCGMAVIQGDGSDAAALENFEKLIDGIRCTPDPSMSPLSLNAALADLLREVGAEVVATPFETAIAVATVVLDGVELEVRSGGMSQVGISLDTMVEIEDGGASALSPELDGDGAVTVCTITHAIRASDPSGTPVALDLAERLLAHPGCGLNEGFGLGVIEAATPAQEEAPLTDEELAARDRRTAEAAAALRGIGAEGGCPDIGMEEFQPYCPAVNAPTGLASISFLWDDTELLLIAEPRRALAERGVITDLAGGQADLGDGDGLQLIVFACGDTTYTLTHDSESTDVHLRAAEAVVGQLGCTPSLS
ncbi:hypothetical protein BH23ACT9_BH23ACT9_26210 [soil metagenome]